MCEMIPFITIIETDKDLITMNDFLEDIGLKTCFSRGKLFIVDPKDKEDDIIRKSKELGLIFSKEREPLWGPVDPITFESEIWGFRCRCWLEKKVLDW